MKRVIYILFFFLLAFYNCQQVDKKITADSASFIRVSGPDLIAPDGSKFFIKGTNLGNWLNPEGYMFNFTKTNSPGRINQMFCEMVGPDFVTEFWKQFKDNYITLDDIKFIKSTGSNTVRLPFHYKLFTDEDYMGLTSNQDGFARIDSVISWCKQTGLYIILDMHDAPGGQTGDNIDDSYGYPWLLESETSQVLTCNIWREIADRYKDEPQILGYDLLNEPIAHYFDNKEELNDKLEPLYKRIVKAVREVDTNHIVILGGAQWNSNFTPFKDFTFDDNMMYSCHRYGGPATADAIHSFISFRDSTSLPMYMGEIGHNTDEWMSDFCKVMEENNISWTFWPYKKMEGSCFAGITPPDNWNLVVEYSETPRTSYEEIRNARPDQSIIRKALTDLITNSRFENCVIQENYINSLHLIAK